MAHLKGEGHSIYILRTPRYEDLPERSTTGDTLLQNPHIRCCNGQLVELISKYKSLHHSTIGKLTIKVPICVAGDRYTLVENCVPQVWRGVQQWVWGWAPPLVWAVQEWQSGPGHEMHGVHCVWEGLCAGGMCAVWNMAWEQVNLLGGLEFRNVLIGTLTLVIL